MKDAFPRFNVFKACCKADSGANARYTQPQSFGFPPIEAFSRYFKGDCPCPEAVVQQLICRQ
ncbi:MAG: hypothetical protein J0I92_20205, partial [Phyllobacterium sp.]|nr:hypothetical protein [Phyllobacterium sp.]